MEYSGFVLTKDEQAVLDHVSGLTRVLPEPTSPICEDRQFVGELVAMRSRMGAMAIQPPKLRLTFDDILKAAEEEQLDSRQSKDNRIFYWLSGRWGIGLVTAASVALAFMTGMAATTTLNHQYAAAESSGISTQLPDALAADEQIAEPPAPHEYLKRGGGIEGGGGISGDGVDLNLYGSIARSGSIHLRHADPASIQRLVTDLVTSSGGMVTNLTRQGFGENTTVRISLAVPSDKYRDFKSKIAAYGEVLDETETTEDVTGAQVDFKARLEEAEEYLTRLEKLIETPTDLSSMQNLERERRNTRLEIERYRKAIAALESRVALSRLDIQVTTAAPAAVQPREPKGELARAFDDGLEGLESVSAFLIKAGLAGSPFLAIGAIAWFFLRRKRKQIERKAA